MVDVATLGLVVDGNGFLRVTDKATGNLKRLGTQADKTESKLKKFGKQVAVIAGIGSLGAISFALVRATKEAAAFSQSMAEVKTLLPAGEALGAVSDEVRKLSVEFAQAPTEQAKALYQVISAGAADSAEAMQILNVANRLAVGGVTAVATAADGLTSLLNAYGKAAGEAESVSDALFVAMRAGKTTVGELSVNLGKVAPLAASASVGIDELLAATAALTKGGISTTESITGLRAIMAAVIKPTSEALEISKDLGFEFNAAALEAQGLAGFMDVLVDKTGGNTEQMAQLFGGVEALVPALALAGTAGDDLAKIMEGMADKAGATGEAFKAVSEEDAFQLSQSIGVLKDVALGLGTSILSGLVPPLKLATDNIDLLKDAAVSLAIALGVVLSVAAVAWFATTAAATWVTVTAFLALATAVNSLSTALVLAQIAMGPAGWVLAGVTAIAAAVFIWKRNTKDMKDAQSELNDELDRGHTLTLANAPLFTLPGGPVTVPRATNGLTEEAIALEKERLALLQQGFEIGVLNVAEVQELLDIEKRLRVELKGGVSDLERRLQVTQQIRDIDNLIFSGLSGIKGNLVGLVDTTFLLETETQRVLAGMRGIEGVTGEISSGAATAAGTFEADWGQAISVVSREMGGFGSLVGSIATGFLTGGAFGAGIAAFGGILGGGGPSVAEQAAIEAQRENNRILEENSRSLERLREQMGGTRGTTVAQFEQAAELFDLLAAQIRQTPTFSVVGLEPQFQTIEEMIASLGFTLEEFAKIAQDAGIQILDDAGKLIDGALGGLDEAILLSIQNLQELEDAFLQNLEVRRLSALGLDDEAEALRRQLREREEIAAAVAQGFSQETIAALEEVQALEAVAAARQKELDILRQQRDFSLNFTERKLIFEGDELGLFTFRRQQQDKRDAEAARALFDAGVITLNQLDDFLALMADATAKAISDFVSSLNVIEDLTITTTLTDPFGPAGEIAQTLQAAKDARSVSGGTRAFDGVSEATALRTNDILLSQLIRLQNIELNTAAIAGPAGRFSGTQTAARPAVQTTRDGITIVVNLKNAIRPDGTVDEQVVGPGVVNALNRALGSLQADANADTGSNKL